MVKVYEFLKKAGIYYLATNEGGQPRVRPFDTVNIFEGKLYFKTANSKSVYMQLIENPKVEICAYCDGRWIRIAGAVERDDRVEARKAMLDAYPDLRPACDEKDGVTEVFYFKQATAIISSFTTEAEVIEIS